MFTIYGNAPPVYDPTAGAPHQPTKVAPTPETELVGEVLLHDKRRHPDRRVQEIPNFSPDRRRRSRRAPMLLGAKTRKPERLTPRKGLHIDISV